MAKLIVELPDETHKELKKTVTLRHQTIKEVVTELVGEYLYKCQTKKGTQGNRSLWKMDR